MKKTFKRFFLAAVICTVMTSKAHAAEFLYRFDMGTPDSPLKGGYTRITPNNIYPAGKGCGWRQKPASAFDRTGSR
ncbi:MAG: hypothetical protein HOC71_00115 [Candidatus Latescibacteria bacterium]|nr:hypothetical protein [Candidatus Latescibacterota bacterium]